MCIQFVLKSNNNRINEGFESRKSVLFFFLNENKERINICGYFCNFLHVFNAIKSDCIYSNAMKKKVQKISDMKEKKMQMKPESHISLFQNISLDEICMIHSL